jgi:hypothetical protein
MLKFKASLDRVNQRKNAENILKVKEIPCNNRITRLIDGIAPGAFDETSAKAPVSSIFDGYWFFRPFFTPKNKYFCPFRGAFLPLEVSILPPGEIFLPLEVSVFPLGESFLTLEESFFPLEVSILHLEVSVFPLEESFLTLKVSFLPLEVLFAAPEAPLSVFIG